MPPDSDTRPQFSLAALFGAAIACGLIFGVLANMETSYRATIRCQTLPADDERLVNWFEELDGVQDVSVLRDGNTINVEFKKRHGPFELVAPPLAELGYTGLKGLKTTISKPSLIGGAVIWVSEVPDAVWFMIAAAFTALLARKIIQCRSVSSTTHIQSDAQKDA